MTFKQSFFGLILRPATHIAYMFSGGFLFFPAHHSEQSVDGLGYVLRKLGACCQQPSLQSAKTVGTLLYNYLHLWLVPP